ncbi:MAG: cupin domain-containing protein [bacterium]|nr:cupin domain-containing protein [bacterium]
MINKDNAGEFKTMKSGIHLKTLVHGDKTHMIKAKLEKGTVLQHSHPHEQTGYLLEGHLKFTFNNKDYNIMPGDSWNIPGNTEHRAEMLEDSIVLEIFSPIREDYLKI